MIATGGVLIDGKLHRVVGRDATFDGVTGIAEVTGQPARLVSTVDSERYTSFVNAELIRAYFDVSADAAKKGSLAARLVPEGRDDRALLRSARSRRQAGPGLRARGACRSSATGPSR